ncbi:MAG: hypothetical protein BWK79_17025 [Beggiatoa sp. IS2]|nr:MAG: hypothetical protein BWK79_17025 [Beggiatoa sp. IS2]
MKQVTAGVLAAIVVTAHSGIAQAEDTSTKNLPFVDYQWTMSSDACPERGLDTLRKSGFKVLDKKERVGMKEGYKGIVACVGEGSDIAVFIVAGPDYERAKSLALKMKDNF